MKELLRRLLQAWLCPGCPYKEQEEPTLLKPEIDRFLVREVAFQDLQAQGVQFLYGNLDNADEYFTSNIAGIWDAVHWIMLTQTMPKYSVDVYGKWNLDCEDFAIWLKGQMSVHFGINSFGLIIGSMPRGIHGFNAFFAENGWLLIEPNPGFGIDRPFRIGEYGYQPTHILV